MKGYFTDNGKYRVGENKVIVVTLDDVKNKTIFDVENKNAQYFSDAGKFTVENKITKKAISDSK